MTCAYLEIHEILTPHTSFVLAQCKVKRSRIFPPLTEKWEKSKIKMLIWGKVFEDHFAFLLGKQWKHISWCCFCFRLFYSYKRPALSSWSTQRVFFVLVRFSNSTSCINNHFFISYELIFFAFPVSFNILSLVLLIPTMNIQQEPQTSERSSSYWLTLRAFLLDCIASHGPGKSRNTVSKCKQRN